MLHTISTCNSTSMCYIPLVHVTALVYVCNALVHVTALVYACYALVHVTALVYVCNALVYVTALICSTHH